MSRAVDNPYESPGADTQASVREDNGSRAVRRFRMVFLTLLIPALYNYWEFDAEAIGQGGFAMSQRILFRATNILGFVLGGLLLWRYGVPILEKISNGLRARWAPAVSGEVWRGVLYRAITRAFYLAVPGAALWAIWVFCIYELQLNFTAISILIGFPAHVLGAAVYLPLLVKWFQLAK